MMLNQAVLLIFAFSVCGIFYTYVGYPVLLRFLAAVRPMQWLREANMPTVSIIIAARNEEKGLRAKLKNTLAIDYPSEKLEIIVASDCSTDGTDEIVNSFEDNGVKLIRPDRRLGKTGVQNLAVENATGEIVLFSDATTHYKSDVLEHMLPSFADDRVGCVAGKLIYEDSSRSSVGKGATNYWNYETFLKQNESLVSSLIGVSGCLYAVRRSAYQPMYPEACSDFLIASVMFRQGLRTVYEPAAICTEETNVRGEEELKMRVRIIAQTLSDIWRNSEMLNPFRFGFFSIELISHKLCRYLVPFFLIVMFAASWLLALTYPVFWIIASIQLVFWAMAIIGLTLMRRSSSMRIFSYPSYFALANLASVIGIYKFLTGETYSYWEPIRNN